MTPSIFYLKIGNSDENLQHKAGFVLRFRALSQIWLHCCCYPKYHMKIHSDSLKNQYILLHLWKIQRLWIIFVTFVR